MLNLQPSELPRWAEMWAMAFALFFGWQVDLGASRWTAIGTTARIFAFTLLLAPSPWLLHRPFMQGVILPFMRAIGVI